MTVKSEKLKEVKWKKLKSESEKWKFCFLKMKSEKWKVTVKSEKLTVKGEEKWKKSEKGSYIDVFSSIPTFLSVTNLKILTLYQQFSFLSLNFIFIDAWHSSIWIKS